MSPKRMFVVVAALVGAALLLAAGPAAAKTHGKHRPSVRAVNNGDCVGSGGTAVTATTFTVGGVTQSRTNGAPWVLICRNSSPATYSVSIGLDQSGTSINEDLGAGYLNTTFVVGFSTGSDAPSMLMTLGDTLGYTITGHAVTITAKPVASTVVNYAGGSPCLSNPYTAACSNADAGTSGTKAFYAAGLRANVRYGADSYAKLAGAYVSANANLFDVQLDSPCFGAMADAGAGAERDLATLLNVKLSGPHTKVDNTTANTGSLTAVLPIATVQACFGGSETPANLVNETSIDRTENGATLPASPTGTGGLQYTIAPGVGGLTITVPTVTFSQPTYGMHFTKPRTGGGAAATTTTPTTTTSTGTISGVTWKPAKGKVTSTFTKGSTAKAYAISAKLAGKTKSGSCAIKGTKVTCTVKGLTKGKWVATITSTLKAGGAGPTASKTVSVK